MKIYRFNESSNIDNNNIFIKNIFMEIDDYCEDNGFMLNYSNPVLNNYKVWIRLKNLTTPVIRNVETAQEVIKFTEAKLNILKKLETLAKRCETNPDLVNFNLNHNATVWRDSTWVNENLMTFNFNFNTIGKAENINQIFSQQGDHLSWNAMLLRKYILDKYGINTYYASCTTEEDDYNEHGLTIEYNKNGESQVKIDDEKINDFKEEFLSLPFFTYFSEYATISEDELSFTRVKSLYLTLDPSIYSADHDNDQRYSYLYQDEQRN